MNRSRAGVVGAVAVLAVACLAAPAVAATPTWRVVQVDHSSTRSSLGTVVATGRNDAWAFGNKKLDSLNTTGPLAEHWNGRTWRAVALPKGLPGGIIAASATSRTDVWAVGTDAPINNNSYVLHWNGIRWSIEKRWSYGDVSGVNALSATNVWVFGTSRVGPFAGTWHYDGHRWTQYKMHFFLTNASVVSSRDIWAVGMDWYTGDGRTVARYDGKRWTRLNVASVLPKATNTELNGILARSAKDVWVVGDAVTIAGTKVSYLPFLLHWDGRRWQRSTVPGRWEPIWPVSDGHGGMWIAGWVPGYPTTPVLEHRSSTGKWTATTIKMGARRAQVEGFAPIPGTTSLWGGGYLAATTGNDTNGAIYRYN